MHRYVSQDRFHGVLGPSYDQFQNSLNVRTDRTVGIRLFMEMKELPFLHDFRRLVNIQQRNFFQPFKQKSTAFAGSNARQSCFL